MKIIGLALLLIALPAFMFLFGGDQRQRRLGYIAIGLLPFVIAVMNLDAAIINWAEWPGYSKGIVITMLDVVALAIVMTHRVTWPPKAILVPYLAYVTITLISATYADVWMAATFYTFQLLRGLLLMVAVCSLCTNWQNIRSIALGLAFGMMIEAGYAFYQKAQGAITVIGTAAHQNQLSMMVYNTLFILVGLALSGDRRKPALYGIASALLVLAASASRAGIGLGGAGLLLLLVLSSKRHMTPMKARILGLSAVLLVLAGSLAFLTLSKRMETHNAESAAMERAAFERAANYMIDDHPAGVGANQYVVSANTGGYSQRAGVVWSGGSRGANVHNFYLLTAAELSWLGTAIVVAMFGFPTAAALRFSWRSRTDPRGELALAITVALTMTALHCLYEWIFVTSEMTYVFTIILGLLSGLINARIKEEKVARKRDKLERSATRAAEPEGVLVQRQRSGA